MSDELPPLPTTKAQKEERMIEATDVLRVCPAALLDRNVPLSNQILQMINRTVAYERAKFEADTRRLDWLEAQGLIGIGHRAHGEYRLFAGAQPFKTLREVCDEEMYEKEER